MPSGLPPIRSIEHQTNYIRGALFQTDRLIEEIPMRMNLQRLVKELMDKEYVEIMGACVVPVLFVPKNIGIWRMCNICKVTNDITVKYHHLILKLDDIFDELHGLCIFSKINFKRN